LVGTEQAAALGDGVREEAFFAFSNAESELFLGKEAFRAGLNALFRDLAIAVVVQGAEFDAGPGGVVHEPAVGV
jgi:hypothetical protein